MNAVVASCLPCLWLASAVPAADLQVIVGEPDHRSALIWAFSDQAGAVRFEFEPDAPDIVLHLDPDQPSQVTLDGLRSGTEYRYRAIGPSAEARGRFVTAPAPGDAAALRFAFGADVAGQNVCRDLEHGLPALAQVAVQRADLFIALGDMIYADNDCEATGRYGNAQIPLMMGAARTPAQFARRWRYNRADPASRALFGSTGYVAVWDDHEAINDFGPDAGAVVGVARSAFAAFNPLRDASTLYRRLRWGAHAELFVLDTRSYRDSNRLVDGPTKTLLGREQREWLMQGLIASDATWKLLVSSVPIAIPTGWPPESGRDGWASGAGDDGFETELALIFAAIADRVDNVVFLSADVHHATAFEYRPVAAAPDFRPRELIVGPLNAGVFPSQDLDPTFNPVRLHYHAPAAAEDIEDFTAAQQWFNFGVVTIDVDGRLDYAVVNGQGAVVAEESFAPKVPRD